MRYRLNRSGERQLNRALRTVTLRRLQRRLGRLTPIEFETLTQPTHAA